MAPVVETGEDISGGVKPAVHTSKRLGFEDTGVKIIVICGRRMKKESGDGGVERADVINCGS